MKVESIKIGKIKEEDLKYAVIGAAFQEKWVFAKHTERSTWEIPGGRREANEDIIVTARRELFEETGAKTFKIKPVCDYSVTREGITSFGRLFYTEIKELGELPDSEIEEVKLFDKLPINLTYTDIQPYLFKEIYLFKFYEGIRKKQILQNYIKT